MAWRIDQAVIRGEIDNTVEGRTTGRIWLAGGGEPLNLMLEGDCWRDLAGTHLRFTNPAPDPAADGATLNRNQTGIVGDMTASRKSKMPTVNPAQCHQHHHTTGGIPYAWKNILYLEWFSEINGRVVIESADYLMEISAHVWTMDEDAEEAQKLANLNAMRDFMAQLIHRRDASDNDAESNGEGELDEFAWEERLKESDRLTDAYQEVLEKYMTDTDSERKEAFVMGWDGLLDALAQRDETDDQDFPEFNQAYGQLVDQACANGDLEAGDQPYDDDDDDEEDWDHPLQIEAQELAMRAMDVVQQDAGPESPAYQLVTNLLQVSGRLAATLNDHDDDFEPETGFILAILKRCLNWLNEAVGACQQLMTMENDPDQLAALAHLRSSVFALRDGIVELRRELR